MTFMTIMTIMTIWVWMLLPYKCPTTSVQLLHFGVKCSNFAIVKQNKKITPSTGKIFSLDRKKMTNVECWMVGGADEEWGMKSEVIQQSIIQQSIIQHRQRRPFHLPPSTFHIPVMAALKLIINNWETVDCGGYSMVKRATIQCFPSRKINSYYG